MNKKTYALVTLFCAIVLFAACSSDNDTGIDYEWKAHNEQVYRDIEAQSPAVYDYRDSESGNGRIYYKNTTNMQTRIDKDGYPYFTDSVVCRYKGWYLDMNNKKVIFDSTEDDNNKQGGVGFRVNKVVDGFSTILQYMKVGDEVEVCMPQQLGYGAYMSNSIPGYTTLFFNIKLLKIIPDNPDEFN